MKDIILNTPAVRSVIHCGEGTFDKYVPELASRQCIVVSDRNVWAYYRDNIWAILGDFVHFHVITPGEDGKTLSSLKEIFNKMIYHKLNRNCTVIAFGGGVVGDIAGLAASLYMRGVRLVQIPTTLLAQVDSSVGGKTAVNMGEVKNIAGTFYQPEEVIVDPIFLESLSDREVRCGLGEIIKYGALNEKIYNLLLKNADNLKDPEFLNEVIYECIKHKAEVVERDEHEVNGLRKSLNLGHTTGHAFELHYGKKSHGEFVLVGMYYEMYIAEKLNTGSKNYFDSLRKLICKVIKVPAYQGISSAVEIAKFDKKNYDGNISLIVPESVGKFNEIKLSAEKYTELLCECAEKIRGSK